jgi:hypothetical protein
MENSKILRYSLKYLDKSKNKATFHKIPLLFADNITFSPKYLEKCYLLYDIFSDEQITEQRCDCRRLRYSDGDKTIYCKKEIGKNGIRKLSEV